TNALAAKSAPCCTAKTVAPIAGKPPGPLTYPCRTPGSEPAGILELTWALGRIPPLIMNPARAIAPIIAAAVYATILLLSFLFKEDESSLRLSICEAFDEGSEEEATIRSDLFFRGRCS